MRISKLKLSLVVVAGGIASPAVAAPLPYQALDPSDYQGFVSNWDGNRPFCAAIASPQEWERVIHPAATMGNSRPFAPPASFWRTHTVLLLAHEGNGGGNDGEVLRTLGVDQRRGRIAVSTRFTPRTAASYTGKFWTAVAVRRPLAATNVDFVEGGRTLCTLRLTSAQRSARRTPRRR